MLPPHPDRLALTLAQRSPKDPGAGPYAAPGPGSADARVGLVLLQARAESALAQRGTDAARARIAAIQPSADLIAGTVQDGVARGYAVALEEAISLCEPAPDTLAFEHEDDDVVVGKPLRKRRDFVLKSGKGARIRFSRKQGVTLIARDADVVINDCIRFEDRSDVGDLDGFVALDGERPRLFSPAFLQAAEWREGPHGSRLRLHGRLGRRPSGFDCRLDFETRSDEDTVRMAVRIRNERINHRLRLRLLGIGGVTRHAGTPSWQRVIHKGRLFDAATLVRSCGQLSTGETQVAVPEAQCSGWIEHKFLLGGIRHSERDEAEGWKPVEIE